MSGIKVGSPCGLHNLQIPSYILVSDRWTAASIKTYIIYLSGIKKNEYRKNESQFGSRLGSSHCEMSNGKTEGILTREASH